MMIENVDRVKKKVLITAKHSYIGNAFAKWIANNYDINFISCRTDEWKQLNFSKYDVVFHVAGIAHVDAKNDMEEMYYKVNCDLTVELAKKAKLEGVKQFIFMSSAIIFGESSTDKQSIIINKDTEPQPNGFYGNSKLQAEKRILPLSSEGFNVVIVRPPMIYGKESKGNFPKLARMARMTPIFPYIKNQRSMLHIDNLSEFIRMMIENEEDGIFHPQNEEYVCSSDMVKLIAEVNGKNLRMTRLFNFLIRFAARKVNAINKVFGTFIYDKEMSRYKEKYCVWNLEESVKLTELDGLNQRCK